MCEKISAGRSLREGIFPFDFLDGKLLPRRSRVWSESSWAEGFDPPRSLEISGSRQSYQLRREANTWSWSDRRDKVVVEYVHQRNTPASSPCWHVL